MRATRAFTPSAAGAGRTAGPAYWPWVQLVRACMRSLDPTELHRCVGSGGPELAELLPELRELLGGISRSVVRDPEALRFRLFEAVVSFLGEIAATDRPLLVVLDDLHAADESSLLLLRYLAGAIGDSRVLVLGAFRDTEPRPEDALERAARRPAARAPGHADPARRIAPDDVETYVRLSTDGSASLQVVDALHSHTAGNPLFIVETVAAPRRGGPARGHGHRGGRAGRRTRCRRAGSHHCLSRATGAHCGFGARARVRSRDASSSSLASGRRRSRHRDRGSPGTAAPGAPGVFGLLARARAGRDLRGDPSRRQRGAAPAGGRSARTSPCRGSRAAPRAARPPLLRGGGGRAGSPYATQAAELAASRLAYEEAARLYGLALTLAERGADADMPSSAICCSDSATLGLGPVTIRRQGHVPARGGGGSRGAGRAAGRAALGYGGRWVWTKGRGDPHLLPLLEEAVQTSPSEDSALRAACSRASPPARWGSRATQHAAAARVCPPRPCRSPAGVGDAAVLAWALDGRKVAIWAPDTLEEQWEIMDEMRELAERAGDPEQIVDARICRLIELMERSELDRFDVEYAAARRVADELGQPGQRRRRRSASVRARPGRAAQPPRRPAGTRPAPQPAPHTLRSSGVLRCLVEVVGELWGGPRRNSAAWRRSSASAPAGANPVVAAKGSPRRSRHARVRGRRPERPGHRAPAVTRRRRDGDVVAAVSPARRLEDLGIELATEHRRHSQRASRRHRQWCEPTLNRIAHPARHDRPDVRALELILRSEQPDRLDDVQRIP